MKSIKLVRPLVSAVIELLRPIHDRLFAWMQRNGLVLSVAHTTVESYTDTVYAICASLPSTYDQPGYDASSLVYTTIGKVKTFPTFGSERPVKEWAPITGAIEKSKGAPNYGGGEMVLGDLPADGGQVILKAAEASPNHYSIKATFPDGEITYFDVLVCSWRASEASEGAFFERKANLQFCRYPVTVAAV